MKGKPPPPSSLPKRLSLIAQTVDSLREGIRSGHWQTQLPGERKLCVELQVGRNTLRSALKELERSGHLEVSSSRQRRIKAKARKKYSNKQQVVGIISPSSQLEMGPRSLLLLDALRNTFSQTGFSMDFHADRSCYSARPSRALKKMVDQSPASIWLLFSSKDPTERWFIKQKIPCMVIGSSRPDITLPSFDIDHRALCHHAGGLLLRKGHRRIALILPKDAFGGEADSEQGLREAVGHSKNTVVNLLSHDESANHLCSLLDETLALPNPPTAFLVARAKHSLAVTVHLLRRGLRIPQDVAVVSTDDDPVLNSISPALTRYTMDAERFARRLTLAARQLTESGILPTHAIRLMPEFLPGETV